MPQILLIITRWLNFATTRFGTGILNQVSAQELIQYLVLTYCVVLLPGVAAIKTFASLAAASSFFHSSQTWLGGTADIRIVDLLSYVIFQETMKGLKADNNSVLYEVSPTPRYDLIDAQGQLL